MKTIVTVSLGSSKKDFEFETKFLGQDFVIHRMGADESTTKAWEIMRRQQAHADAIGLSEISDHINVGMRTLINRETRRLTKVVTRVPVTTGATLRRLLQVRAVRHVQKTLGPYFNNNIVLFLSGMRNYDMAVAMSDYTKNLNFADALLQTGAPALLTSLDQLELYAKGAELVLNGRPGRILEQALPGFKNQRLSHSVAESHVVVGTFGEIKAVGTPANLEGKTLITSAVDDERMAFFKECKVNLVVDVSPKLFERVVGINVLEAMMLAVLERNADEVSDDDFNEILDELEVEPRLLHPTGKFRNIRRFAFVVHPLSQEYIKSAFPIPKATPKIVMDQVEKLAAHMPPFVYCKMDNIVSPTGAEAEGWLISVGGTPKEMLAHTPEFTYRRLLAAAKIAEQKGAQIMGLGAFTKVVGDAGITVARRASIPITTGNSYSASGALWAAADAMRRMNLVSLGENGKVAAKTMVIGASGSIGSVSARLLAMTFDEVYLAGRTLGKLEELKASILKETPEAKVFTTIDYDDLLADMDMIVTSTSGAGKSILNINKVKPGCVITDVARPLDLPASEVAKRPDVLVVESGEIELPSLCRMKDIGLPKNVIYACLAETIVLALEGRFEVFTVGRDTEWEKVKEIYKMGLKHGMKLAAISGVNGVYTDADIAKVVTLAKKALLTWKSSKAAKLGKPAAAGTPARKAPAKKAAGTASATSGTSSARRPKVAKAADGVATPADKPATGTPTAKASPTRKALPRKVAAAVEESVAENTEPTAS